MNCARIAALLVLIGLAGSYVAHPQDKAQPSPAPSAQATEPWHKEFDEVCSKTQDAMTLSVAELTDLIRRCDALVPEIEKLNESQKKLYLGRLRMCRGLYAYVLDAKQEASGDDAKKPEKK